MARLVSRATPVESIGVSTRQDSTARVAQVVLHERAPPSPPTREGALSARRGEERPAIETAEGRLQASERTEGSESLPSLILRLQDGDESALEPLVRHTSGMAFRLARSVLRDQTQAEDAVQEAYVIVFREIRVLKEPAAFRTWFGRIIINHCRRMLRKPRADSLDELLEQGHAPATSGGQESVEQRADLKRALDHLTDIDRSVLMLREVMQYSYEEVAAALGVPLGTVKSRLSEARRRLLKAWQGPPATATGRGTASARGVDASGRGSILRSILSFLGNCLAGWRGGRLGLEGGVAL